MANQHPHEYHPKPSSHNGFYLDELVWREIVDYGLKRPEVIEEQVLSKVKKLQEEGESIDGEIVKANDMLVNLHEQRSFYQRQAARGKITEAEFDARMDETAEAIKEWEEEKERLQTLRTDAKRVQVSLDYARALFGKIVEKLDYLNCDRETLFAMEEDERRRILTSRKEIIQALVDRITINSKREVVIEGVIDGSEAMQFELMGYWNQILKLSFSLNFSVASSYVSLSDEIIKGVPVLT